jgi:hypothetical protein
MYQRAHYLVNVRWSYRNVGTANRNTLVSVVALASLTHIICQRKTSCICMGPPRPVFDEMAARWSVHKLCMVFGTLLASTLFSFLYIS